VNSPSTLYIGDCELNLTHSNFECLVSDENDALTPVALPNWGSNKTATLISLEYWEELHARWQKCDFRHLKLRLWIIYDIKIIEFSPSLGPASTTKYVNPRRGISTRSAFDAFLWVRVSAVLADRNFVISTYDSVRKMLIFIRKKDEGQEGLILTHMMRTRKMRLMMRTAQAGPCMIQSIFDSRIHEQ
jgi:hypothetical protein